MLDTLRPGEILRDRYEILRILHAGGMGAVYEARDLDIPGTVRLCTVKEIVHRPNTQQSQAEQERAFEQVVRRLADLSHPSLPRVFDFFSIGSRSYLVQDLIRGQTLETYLRQSAGSLPERAVVRWAIEICDALYYLHSQRPEPIVVGVMKPSHVMLDEHDHIMLLDYGLALAMFPRLVDDIAHGAEAYCPPEFFQGTVNPSSDLYGLGAMVFCLVTATDITKEAVDAIQGSDKPTHQLPSVVSPALAAIIQRALAADPGDRFHSAEEMRLALWEASAQKDKPFAGRLSLKGGDQIDALWSFECGDEVRSSPRAGDRMVFVGSYDHHLYSFDATRGTMHWKYTTGGGIAATPLLWEDLILIGSEDGCMHAVSAGTGWKNWIFRTHGRVRSSARLAYGHAFFGSDDGSIYGIQARSGKVIWESPAGGPVRSTPAIGEESLFVGCQDGYVYALSLKRGSMLWRYQCDGPVTSSPALWEGKVIVGSFDRFVHAIDAASGWSAWRYRTGNAIISSPAIFEDAIFIGSADGNLYALEASSGKMVWKYETQGQVNSSPAVTCDTVYVGSSDGCVYAIDRLTGKLRWKFKTGGAVVSSPCVHERIVFVGSMDSRLYALPAISS